MVPLPDRTSSERQIFERTTLFVVLSLGLGLLFDLLLFDKLPGISFPLFVVATLGFIFASAHVQHRKFPKSALFMVPLLLFFSGMVYVRASGALTFFNVVISLYLLIMFVVLTLRPGLRLYRFKDYFSEALKLPFKALESARLGLAPLAVGGDLATKYPALPSIVRGVAIALPVLLLFVLLFSSADLIFRQYVTDIFSFDINADLFWRMVWALVVASGFFGLFALLGRKQKSAQQDQLAGAVRHGRGALTEVTILFGSLNVLFLTFILIQLAYLFGGVNNVVGGDFTYAEYARKGFFELIAVAGLSYLLIFVTERLLLREGQRHSLKFKVLSGALVVQVLIILVSAFKRLQLYENAYGYTSLRLYSHIFIIWMAVVLVGLLYKIFADKRESTLAFYMFVSVIALFASFNFLNVDGWVARKNIERYEATNKLDVRYINELSDDATSEIVGLLDSKDPEVKAAVGQRLYERRQVLLETSGVWQSANVTRRSALQALDERQDLLEQYKNWPVDPSYRGPGH